jgi:acyl-CoA synthetase (NDP forming)
MFRQSGIIRAVDEVELFDVATALLSLPLPRGKRVGILTEGGGIGVVMAEAVEKVGLELPAFTSATTEKLKSLLPARCSYGNPTDITDLVTSGELLIFSCLWSIMEDPNVDAAVLLGGIGASSYFASVLESAHLSNKEEFKNLVESLKEQELKHLNTMREKIDELQKPLVYVNLMPRVMEEPESFKFLREKGIPIYPNPRRAARVLHQIVRYSNYLKETA